MKNYEKWTTALLGTLFFISPSFAQQKTWHCVAQNDCGEPSEQSFLVKGENYTMLPPVKGDKKALTCNFGSKVIYAFNQLDIHADYQLEVAYLSDGERQQHIVVDGNELQNVTLLPNKEQRYRIDLPRKAFAYGQLVLVFENTGKGPNAIVNELNLYSSNPQAPVPFKGQAKRALQNTVTYHIDTTVCAEKVLPTYTVKPKAVKGTYAPILSLNGSWKFNAKPSSDFYKQTLDNSWKNIVVPGQWSMQGHEVDSAAFAGYRKTFSLPDDWQGQRILLRFDGVHSEYHVYINGKKAGYHLGGMTAYETDITPLVKPGENEIALAVRSESLADMLGSLTQYAAHQLGGITRKVTLMAVPEIHLSDLRTQTLLDKNYKNALFKVHAAVKNTTGKAQQDVCVRITFDGLPNVIEKKLPVLDANATWTGMLNDSIVAPQLWNNEQPHLYTMKTEVWQGNEMLEMTEKRIGFREVKLQGNRVMVNGVPVKLRGVCHHEMHPLSGRVLTPELLRKDVELYRAANCNFIRTSHYPPCEEMLDLCDELGMFVEVESPVCWIGHHANENWQQLNYQDKKYYDYVLQANMETIHFYRNHPAVLFWSMANESYWNEHFAQVEEYVKKADPTRPHTFHDQAYGGFNNQGSTAPIANIHYPGPDGYKVAAKSDRPMVYGEYCHLNVYNRRELVTDPGVRSDWALALTPTWENMYKTPGVLGGSIWSGIDDIFQLPNGNAVGYGAWGPIDGWRRPKPEYWDMKKIYSPIRVWTKELKPAHALILNVENRYSYLNLNDLKVSYRYGKEQGVVNCDLACGQQGEIRIPIAHPEAANELYLSFTDPRGFVADEYLLPVGKQEQNELPDWTAQPTKLKKDKTVFRIVGKDFSCSISRATGQILSLKKGGKDKVVGGPYLMALPLTGGGCYPNHNANTPVFNELCKNWKATSVTADKTDGGVIITVAGQYNEFEGQYRLLVNANGELTATYEFKALADVNPRQWGLVFEAPKSFSEVFWRRKGMWSVYPENHISRPVGTAQLFYAGLPQQVNPRVAPSWNWSYDFNELGSNDFRSTRRNIWYAGLQSPQGDKVTVRSNGQQHWRSWFEGDRIRFLVADFVTAGNEMFLGAYYAPYRKPLKKGDVISGKITLRAE